MIDFPWKIFSQTGNIETYLLMKEMETVYDKDATSMSDIKEEVSELDNN
ncbi:YqzL family protein [Sediminibacillus massiliensis]|nr:YqzL family protein [Sediminibacillus massiliensis]